MIMIVKKSICLILLLAMALFSGCAENNPSTTPNISSQENSKSSGGSQAELTDNQTLVFMQDIQKLSDQELLDKYINGLDICLIGENELIFENPDEISSETLYMFYLYTLNNGDDSKYKEYERQWLKKDNQFHIPIKDIKAVLDRYFEHYLLDPTKIHGYSTSEDAVVTPTISGFGGCRFTKVKDKEFDHDKLTLLVDFYDESYQKVHYSKEYLIRFYETVYYLLSVIKK